MPVFFQLCSIANKQRPIVVLAPVERKKFLCPSLPFPHQQANPPAAITNMGQSLNAPSGRAAAAAASQPPPSPPGYAAAEARARELLAGPFSCYADEVKGTGAAMRQLFDAWDAAGPGAPPPAWDILRGRPGGC